LRVSRVRLCQISAAGSGDAPNITLVSENVFESADVILVPMIPTTLSMMTYRKLVQFFDEAGLDKKTASFFILGGAPQADASPDHTGNYRGQDQPDEHLHPV
jgi:hypothetical protein